MKKIKNVKISIRLIVSFTILLVLSIFHGIVGSWGLQQINNQKQISQLANRSLVDFQDAQLAVAKYIYSHEKSYMDTVEKETALVLTQAQAAEDLMLNEENKIHIGALIHSITVYRDLSRQLFENQNDERLSQNRILTQLENDSCVIMANARDIRDDVDDITGSIINRHRHITFLLFFLISLVGGFLALLLTKSLKQQLGAEPYEIEDVASKISQGNFHVKFPERNLSGVFLSLKRMMEKLAETTASNEVLSITLKSIGDGFITTDLRGNITFINPVTEELTGWTNEEAFGEALEKVFHIVHEQTKEVCVNPAQKVLESGELIELANHTCLISKKGEWYVIEDSAAPILDHEQNILGVVIVFRDVTEKKKMRDSVQKMDRLESLGVLAGGIAHDFNNYLAGIFGYVELVKNKIETGTVEKNREYLTKVLKISESAKSLTQQLMTFSKGGKPDKELTSLDEIIRTSVHFALSGTSIVSHLSIEDDLWSCLCDKNRISQCIDNLVINAIQAMPGGGALSVSVKNLLEEVPPQLEGDSYIEMKIEDTGSGIPTTLLEKIFDPFFSTKEKGNGLGLATVFSIIKNHDGWIDVQSEPGEGSSFTLYLPASRSEKPFRNDRVIDYRAGTGHILVLDDKEYILEILKDMIEAMGYEAILTEKSSEAFRIVQEDYRTDGRIKACILDQTLPGDLYGHEVARKIHEIAPDLPLIASSGYVESDVMINPGQYHFSACIAKPFDSQKLSEILHSNITEPGA